MMTEVLYSDKMGSIIDDKSLGRETSNNNLN